jgi:hypothetical protein
MNVFNLIGIVVTLVPVFFILKTSIVMIKDRRLN